MNNPFGDTPATDNPFGDPVAGDGNPFGDPVAEPERGYIGASAKAGFEEVKALGWRALQSVADIVQDPMGTRAFQQQVLEQHQDNPRVREELANREKLRFTGFDRRAQANTAKAAEVMGRLTPEGQVSAGKEYATTDADKSAVLDPTRVAGDVARSLPTTGAMLGSIMFTRGASNAAFDTVLAETGNAALARIAATRAAASTMAKTSATSEGLVGAGLQYDKTLAAGGKIDEAKWSVNPKYQEMIQKGWDPDAAKQKLIREAAEEAAVGAGAANAATNLVGGYVLGRTIGEGGKVIPRVFKGAATEGLTEAIQSPGEQLSENVATKRNLDPTKDLTEGLAESTVAGGVVGAAMGGAFAGVGGAHMHQDEATVKAQKAETLRRLSDAQEMKVASGIDPVQSDVAATVTKQAGKPRLNAQQAKVFSAATSVGLDPMTPLVIAAVESNTDPAAKNPTSTAEGIFQIIDKTWNELGGGDRKDPDLQIQRGLQLLAQNNQALEKNLGRPPSMTESYLAHMFGVDLASKFIREEPGDPSGDFLAFVKKHNPSQAENIVKGNGFTGRQNQEVMNSIGTKLMQKARALGFDEKANLTASAQQPDIPPPNALDDPDAIMAEIDGLLATEQAAKPPTDAERAASREELAMEEELNTPREAAPIDEIFTEDQAQRGVELEAEAAKVRAEPTLPRDLSGATPRYGIGQQVYDIKFSDDMDKAAYIVADGAKKSLRDGDYLSFVMQNTGMNEAEARAYGKDVRTQLKRLAGTLAKANAKLPADQRMLTIDLSSLTRNSETGVSMAEAYGKAEYDNPNDSMPLARLPILASVNPEAIGKSLKEHLLVPGEVAAVGVDSKLAPAEYIAGVQEAAQAVISKFAPKARVAISFQTGRGDAVASVARVGKLGRATSASQTSAGLYHINMRNATNLGVTSWGSTNHTTQIKIISALHHELGHVITDERMTEGMSPELLVRFRNLGAEELFTEQEIASLSPEQGAVLTEYNGLKQRVLTDPKFTQQMFVEEWLGPWKIAHGWGSGQGPRSFIKMFLGETYAQRMDAPAREMALALHQLTDILSPHEYMAEQMARYAYSTKMFEQGSLAREFFHRAIQALRQFFQLLKAGGDVRPGIAFAEWVDSLTASTKAAVDRGATINKAVTAEKPRRETKPRVKLADVQAEAKKKAVPFDAMPPVVTSEPDIGQISDMSPGAPIETIRAALQFLARNESMQYVKEINPERYKNLVALARMGRIDEFKYEIAQDLDIAEMRDILFDTSEPEHQQWADVAFELVDKMPKRTGLRTWFPHSMGRLLQARHMFVTMNQEAYANPEVAGLQVIEHFKGLFKAFKAKLAFHGLEAINVTSKLGKEQAGLLWRAMRDEHRRDVNFAELQMVNQAWRYVPSQALSLYAEANGMEPETVQAWLALKNAHLIQLNMLHSVMQSKLIEKYKGKPVTLRVKVADTAALFDSIRRKPFLPQTRFGRYALKVVEPAPDGGRNTVHVEFFESQAMRAEGLATIKGHLLEGQKVIAADYGNSAHILRTLPPQLITTFGDALSLTEQERKELREMADGVTRNPRLRKYSNQLAGITGANKDLLRNFADFFGHNANNVAKFAYASNFRNGLQMIQTDMMQAAEEGDLENHAKLQHLRDFSAAYVDHMLNPADEWQMIRGLVVVKMLWGQIKTALMNLTSLNMLWSINASQQGLLKGTMTTTSAMMKIMHQTIGNAMSKVGGLPATAGANLPPDHRWAMNKAREEGLFDESYAAQLATFSNVGTLKRLNFQRSEDFIRKVVWAGMQPQHLVENFTRQVALYAQFDTYRKQGLSRQESYTRAVGDVKRINGDNTILNRPKFMRGKASAFTIFYSFTQNALYNLAGTQERSRRFNEALKSPEAAGMTTEELRKKYYKIDPIRGETTKMWLSYLWLAGMMGLPGAEDLDKIVELVSRSMFGHRFSIHEHAFALASALSEEASALGMDITPRSFVHGNLSDVNFFGLMPGIDVSASAGLGQAVPGAGGIDKLNAGSGGTGDMFLAAMGPLGSTIRQIGQAFSDDASASQRIGGFMPNVINNGVKTFGEWQHGVEYPNGGKVTVDLKTGTVRDLSTGENIMRLMGFQPTVITANKELHYLQEDMRKYWTAKRNGLVTQAVEASRHGDREAMADAADAIEKFNADSPTELAIKQRDVLKSTKRRAKIVAKTENRRSTEKRFEKLYEKMQGDFLGDE